MTPYCSRCHKVKEHPRQTYCNACHADYSREWTKKNVNGWKEKHREQNRKWAREHKEIIDRNSKKHALEHPGYRAEQTKIYRHRRPQVRRDLNRIHQARYRVSGVQGSLTRQGWLSLKAKYGYTCLCCGRKEPEITLSLDHVIPLSVGGSNDIENAQPLCTECNIRKRDRTIDYRPGWIPTASIVQLSLFDTVE